MVKICLHYHWSLCYLLYVAIVKQMFVRRVESLLFSSKHCQFALIKCCFVLRRKSIYIFNECKCTTKIHIDLDMIFHTFFKFSYLYDLNKSGFLCRCFIQKLIITPNTLFSFKIEIFDFKGSSNVFILLCNQEIVTNKPSKASLAIWS